MPFPWMAAATAFSGAAGMQGGDDNSHITNARIWQANMDWQREMATSGVKMRVEDAQAAGVHPLAALGGNLASGPTVQAGDLRSSSGMPGQDISRGIMATMTAYERGKVVAKEMESKELDIEAKKLNLLRMKRELNPPLASHSEMPGLTGSGYVNEMPLQRVHSMPGNPGREVGAVPDAGFSRSTGGLSVLPSRDVKERIEDQIIPETMWAIRNYVLPILRGYRRRPRAGTLRPPRGMRWKMTVDGFKAVPDKRRIVPATMRRR